ncbi:uncharacterized protein LOC120320448 isoform X2 [Drosophila yakuba]|uniref:uncharacterized protein LOC120320448 isoform X2 n=1 Tax=Drosophila yakuba TaxID=7245 RepID=UPI00193078B9|nr:uncharacterized protein LOC120320448 isoform X2 [Drosophila yakuba]
MKIYFTHHYSLDTSMELLKVCSIVSLIFAHELEIAGATGKCKFSPTYFQNFTLEIRNNTLYMDMTTSKPIHRGLKVFLNTQISLDKGRSYQRLFAHILDTCGVVSSVRGNLFKSWFDSMLKHGNFMVNCPVPAGHYFLRDWKLDSQLVPHYLLPGDYCITAHFFFGKHKSKQEDFFLDLEVFALLKAT